MFISLVEILPILMYGSSVWGLPRSQNLIYIENQAENMDTRTIVTNALATITQRVVPFEYARRVGRRTEEGEPRKILVKLKSYSDKLEIIGLSDRIVRQVAVKSNIVQGLFLMSMWCGYHNV